MISKHIPRKKLLLFTGDLILIAATYATAAAIRYGGIPQATLLETGTFAALLGIFAFIFYLFGLYDLELKFKHARYLYKHITAVTVAAAMMSIGFFFIPSLQTGRGVFLISVFLAGAGTWLWRLYFDFLFGKNIMRQKTVLIVGAGRAGKLMYETIKDLADYRVVGLMSDGDPSRWNAESLPRVLGGPGMLRDMIRSRGVNIIVLAIADFHDSALLRAALECKLDGVEVYDMPSFYEQVTGKVPVDHVTDFWLLFTPLLGVKKSIYNLRVKRVLDILLSLAGIVISLPVAILTAIAIKLDSRGPVLFKQARVGLNDEIFTLLKFRSMKTGTDSDRRFAGDVDDPRITCVGKIARKFRIDELPQMWNVLRGDMSFIGPRALMVDEVHEFESHIPYFLLRHSVRPGITGWAQVNYRHGAKVEDAIEKLQYDLFYIKNLSALLEFHILLKTVKVVLLARGAR